MRIVELDEKSPRLKNRKVMLEISQKELTFLGEIIENNARDIKEEISREKSEMVIVYQKGEFDMLTFLNNLCQVINEAILRKGNLEVTYEQLDILWRFILNESRYIKDKLASYGRTLMPQLDSKRAMIENIISSNELIYNKVIKKLYPKREAVINLLKDYEEESSYNGFFIETEAQVTLHIPMKEKDDVLQGIDAVMLDIEQKKVNSIISGSREMPIEIISVEISSVLHKVAGILAKDIHSGSKFPINIKDYFILKTTLNSHD